MDSDPSAFFGVVDYIIFGGMLTISTLIGVYFAFFAKQKQDNAQEYLMGGKTMGIFPIAMSLIASDISGISMMGIPSEVYTFGTLIFLNVIAEVLAQIINVYFILPVLYHLDITSSYEYLELRFNSTLRKFGSLLYIISNLLYTPVVIYIPALALSQVSGIGLAVLLPLMCAVCTFYTTLGGLKAVVWADAFQTIIIILGVISIAIVGTVNVGGVSKIFMANEEAGRIEILNLSWDITVRQTFWTMLTGKFITDLTYLSVSQSMVQRYLALATIKQAKIAIVILVIGVSILGSFCCYTGLVIFAAFHDCDPLSLGHLRKADGIVAYYLMKYTKHIPALPGIFMAGVFSAALSTLSTCQNSMCGVIFEDFIRPNLKKDISEAKSSLIMKIIAVIIGVVTGILSGVVDKLGGVMQTKEAFSAISTGTLLGLYLLGIFLPWVNSTGALAGGIVASLTVGWISLGGQYAIAKQQIIYPMKPFSIEGCDNDTQIYYYSRLNESLQQLPAADQLPEEPFPLFRLTFLLYAPLGLLVCVVVGLLASWISGFQQVSQLDGKLFTPFLRPYLQTKDKCQPKENDAQEKGKLLS